MKFSEAWLREWVDPALERADLLHQLTMAGLEVDGVEPVADAFTGVVLGRIEQCDKHPDADKLSVCQVSDGEATVQVVCGAPNARVGLYTAFAKVGAVLPGDFKIKKAKLRGVESFGMLCSAQELGLGDDHSGIMELPAEGAIGSDLRDVLALDDVTVDLDLTPNRGDCLSLKGIAREVGVLNNLPVVYPEISSVPAAIEETFGVSIENGVGCPRYLGRVLKGVDLSRPSPHWMQERLRRCGLRSIDPVVDVTNYVLIELGQPMHAFDLRQLQGEIVVRNARAGDTLTLLDGQEVTLDPDTLLITDAGGPVAIAGVMGGARSGVQLGTQDVFLECAFFAPLAVAGTARRYGLQTDASHRYERGVDYGLQHDAIERATALLLDIVGGQPGPVVETLSQENLPGVNEVRLREKRLVSLLGVDIDASQVDEAFDRLGFAVSERKETEDGVEWLINSPSHRFDIAIEADLVEEICRIYGYNNIPVKQPVTELSLRTVDLDSHPVPELKRRMAGAGFQELVTYSFVEPQLVDLLDPGVEPLTLANPMSSEQSVMRTNLLPGLVEAARSNKARQQDGLKLFELGTVFRPGVDGLAQVDYLGGLVWGRRGVESWHTNAADVDFFDVKGEVDQLLEWAGYRDVRYVRADDPVLHPGQCAEVWVAGERVGRIGRLHPEIERVLDFADVYVFEIVAESALARPPRRHAGVSKFPSVRRDLAIVVPDGVAAQDVERVVRESLDDILVEFTLFDVYQGKGIDSNEKSLAIGLTLQSQTATLTEEEIGEHAQIALKALEGRFGARLR
jgi:phenylalanyl-tRNA synthetase beta chain